MSKDMIKDITLTVVALALALALIIVNASYTSSACNSGAGVAYTTSDGGIVCK